MSFFSFFLSSAPSVLIYYNSLQIFSRWCLKQNEKWAKIHELDRATQWCLFTLCSSSKHKVILFFFCLTFLLSFSFSFLDLLKAACHLGCANVVVYVCRVGGGKKKTLWPPSWPTGNPHRNKENSIQATKSHLNTWKKRKYMMFLSKVPDWPSTATSSPPLIEPFRVAGFSTWPGCKNWPD